MVDYYAEWQTTIPHGSLPFRVVQLMKSLGGTHCRVPDRGGGLIKTDNTHDVYQWVSEWGMGATWAYLSSMKLNDIIFEKPDQHTPS